MRAPARCPKCLHILPAAAEHPDGLPGIKYRTCNNCGYTRAETRRAPKERLDEKKPPKQTP
jgi:Zn ribbon nucleic-acid-binding protein